MAAIALVNVLLTFGLLEASLRIQQHLGPLYDLDLRSDRRLIEFVEDEALNHTHAPGGDWDENGVRRMDEPNVPDCAPRILFMGDSFMQGLAARDTIPVHVQHYFRQSLGRQPCVFNAGAESYSPSVYVPQAKKLIPRLKPDFVLIDIDESDLFDDYYHYRGFVLRDGSGSIVAVQPTPLTFLLQRGLLDSTDKFLYLHRFLAKLYFTRLEYPRLKAQYEQGGPDNVFWASTGTAEDARDRFQTQIDYFAATIEDLTRTVLLLTGGSDRLIYLHHPHLEHLAAGAIVFNDVVAATVRVVASRYHVKYYDATADLKMEFGSAPDKFYIPNDPHFNAAGLRAYGTAVARYLATTLDGR